LKDLLGKNILLIAPRFFGYERDIRNELEKRGARVDWLVDRPFDKPWQMATTRLLPSLVLPVVTRHSYKALEELGATNYDLIFAVNPVTLAPELMQLLRRSFPAAQMILYMWDSMENRKHVEKILSYFDQTFSFDPLSNTNYGMKFRPLFYLEEYKNEKIFEKSFDLSFIGTIHADRYAIIDRLSNNLPKNTNFFKYLYLQAEWVYWSFRVIKSSMRHAKKSDFQFKPLAKNKVQEIFSHSLAIADIEHPKQRGLTMRTFESLGANKKLVTTNLNIQQYDFYNKNNICIIDRNNPQVPLDFLMSPYQKIPLHLYEKYSLSGWINEVLGLESSN